MTSEGPGTKNYRGHFPGGPAVKIPLCNAGDVGTIPGQGTRILHAVGQLSPHATTTEPVLQLESPCNAMKDPT